MPSGDTCAQVIPLVDNVPVTTNLVGMTKDYTEGLRCTVSAGPEAVYSITVPFDWQVRLTATPLGATADAVVNVMDSCGSFVACLTTADAAGAGQPETAIFRNFGAARTLFFTVSTKSLATASPMTVVARLFQNAPGDVCETAIPVTLAPVGQSLMGTHTTEFAFPDILNATVTMSCPGYPSGRANERDVVYRFDLPAGRSVRADVTPLSGWDPFIYFVLGPASNCSATSTACVSSGDGNRGYTADAESITHANTTTATQSLFLVIDSSRVDPGTFSGSFRLVLTQL